MVLQQLRKKKIKSAKCNNRIRSNNKTRKIYKFKNLQYKNQKKLKMYIMALFTPVNMRCKYICIQVVCQDVHKQKIIISHSDAVCDIVFKMNGFQKVKLFSSCSILFFHSPTPLMAFHDEEKQKNSSGNPTRPGRTLSLYQT